MYVRLGIRDRRNVRPELDAFLEAMKHADLFVVCGAGGFTDATRDWSMSTLNTVEEAIQRQVPVAMFGQGLGPLTDVYVQRRARRVLPKVSLLSLRGAQGGQALAQKFGINPPQLVITGDEAIELAYEARAQHPGEAVGINIRVASYSNVDQEMVDLARPVFQDFARRRKVPLVPIPIAFHAWANDHLTIKRLLEGFDDRSDGGVTLDTPLKVIKQTGRCRFVVAGAYHAAVFALSQGISVIGLSASDDYTAKFLGLKEQFGVGCELVLLNKLDAWAKLALAMNEMWKLADTFRPSLLAAADRQIESSRRAYAQVKESLSCHTNGRHEQSSRFGRTVFTSEI
jgi:colanic acid/amylovoran biosynthesis protein